MPVDVPPAFHLLQEKNLPVADRDYPGIFPKKAELTVVPCRLSRNICPLGRWIDASFPRTPKPATQIRERGLWKSTISPPNLTVNPSSNLAYVLTRQTIHCLRGSKEKSCPAPPTRTPATAMAQGTRFARAVIANLRGHWRPAKEPRYRNRAPSQRPTQSTRLAGYLGLLSSRFSTFSAILACSRSSKISTSPAKSTCPSGPMWSLWPVHPAAFAAITPSFITRTASCLL